MLRKTLFDVHLHTDTELGRFHVANSFRAAIQCAKLNVASDKSDVLHDQFALHNTTKSLPEPRRTARNTQGFLSSNRVLQHEITLDIELFEKAYGYIRQYY